jgi:predicted ABC-type transport system involved in lysophospholipase L1 biosynthesis ATPase subunit
MQGRSACALILVTHNEELAARCDRRIRLADRHLTEERG